MQNGKLKTSFSLILNNLHWDQILKNPFSNTSDCFYFCASSFTFKKKQTLGIQLTLVNLNAVIMFY